MTEIRWTTDKGAEVVIGDHTAKVNGYIVLTLHVETHPKYGICIVDHDRNIWVRIPEEHVAEITERAAAYEAWREAEGRKARAARRAERAKGLCPYCHTYCHGDCRS